jgi:peptidoglycan/LPS O-acetylase OafA/YrhL
MTKVYLIYAVERKGLGMMNFLTTAFFSVALALWAFGGGIIVSLINYDALNPESKVLLDYGPWVLGILGAIFMGLAVWAYVQGKGISDDMDSESRVHNVPPLS